TIPNLSSAPSWPRACSRRRHGLTRHGGACNGAGESLMIFGLWRSRKDEARVLPIYSGIVAQARQPVFYAGLGVPDTLEGRYDMLMLHAWLYMRRLNGEDEP